MFVYKLETLLLVFEYVLLYKVNVVTMNYISQPFNLPVSVKLSCQNTGYSVVL